mmetsp:Transcript_66401/g.210154  ORF Transcript_66401/g.210154 Transcript_66401/m.210154 type:complete len:192 (+) Transcript_66401:254-829(+)
MSIQWSAPLFTFGCDCCKPCDVCVMATFCPGAMYANNSRMLETGIPTDACDWSCQGEGWWMRCLNVECCQLAIVLSAEIPLAGNAIQIIFAHLLASCTRGVRVKTARKYGINTTALGDQLCGGCEYNCILCKPGHGCSICGCENGEEMVAHDSHCCCFCCSLIQEHKTHTAFLVPKAVNAPPTQDYGMSRT